MRRGDYTFGGLIEPCGEVNFIHRAAHGSVAQGGSETSGDVSVDPVKSTEMLAEL